MISKLIRISELYEAVFPLDFCVARSPEGSCMPRIFSEFYVPRIFVRPEFSGCQDVSVEKPATVANTDARER
jgi:hypothetical protein